MKRWVIILTAILFAVGCTTYIVTAKTKVNMDFAIKGEAVFHYVAQGDGSIVSFDEQR